MNFEARRSLRFRQHSSISQSIEARTKPVLVDEISHAKCSELSVGLTSAGGAARANSLLVEDFGDLGANVVVEKLVDEIDDLWLGLCLLRRRFGILCRQGLCFAALEADMDPGDSFCRKFDQRDILDDVGEQPFALAVRQTLMAPERFEVCRHGDEPIPDCIVESKTVLLPATLAFLLGFGQCAQLVVPFTFEGIRYKTVIGIG